MRREIISCDACGGRAGNGDVDGLEIEVRVRGLGLAEIATLGRAIEGLKDVCVDCRRDFIKVMDLWRKERAATPKAPMVDAQPAKVGAPT